MIEVPTAVIADIVRRTESLLGLAPNVAQFHAYNEHQQPLPDQLTATQYAEWLLKTNSERAHDELDMLARRYRDAFNSQRTAIGITPGQLAHLAIAADVLELLVQNGQPSAPVLAPMPAVPPAASAPLAAPLPTPVAVASPKQTNTTTVPEQKEDLQLLRQQLLSELRLPNDSSALTTAQLHETVESQLKEQSVELNRLEQNGAITPSDREAKLQHIRRELERRVIELQSIEARMHLQQKTSAPAPTGSTASLHVALGDHTGAIETLRKQEQAVLAEMDAMEKILDHAGLPPEELQHIRHQLHAVEELMQDIEAETK